MILIQRIGDKTFAIRLSHQISDPRAKALTLASLSLREREKESFA
jgi:hypothetical protein